MSVLLRDAGEIYSSSICRFMTKYIVNFLKIRLNSLTTFEKHFIDMSFRMLFHSHCIEKIDGLVEK